MLQRALKRHPPALKNGLKSATGQATLSGAARAEADRMAEAAAAELLALEEPGAVKKQGKKQGKRKAAASGAAATALAPSQPAAAEAIVERCRTTGKNPTASFMRRLCSVLERRAVDC